MIGRPSRTRDQPEQGFTFIEMIVALAVLAITLLAATPFFVNSLQSVNKQRTRQAAIQLANTAMEQVRGLKGSSLLAGHGQQAGEDQFAAAPAVVRSYLATMQIGWDADSAVLPTDGADAPISTAPQVMTVEGTPFTRMIYIGACEIYLTSSSGACVRPVGSAAEPADKTKILKFFRAVVLITWPDNSCSRTAGNPPDTCSYISSTLVSRAPEPQFDLKRPSPVVLTTSLTFYRGRPAPDTAQLEARGGQLPNTWTVTKLPAGLSLSASGRITGTPTTAGTTAAKVTVTDKLGRTDPADITFVVVPPTTVTVPATATHHAGEAVSVQATAADGVGPYVYTAAGLAPGLTIDAGTGLITGTITAPGTYHSTVTATDQNGVDGSSPYVHTVYPAVTLDPPADQAITLNDKLVLTAAGAGGDGKYTYSATGLPSGVTINKSTGAVNDKVSVSGRFLPTITVTDGLGGTGGTASRRFVLLVGTTSSLIFTAPDLAAPDRTTARGTAASMALATNGGLLGLSPVVTVTGLPPGLSHNALTGVISGTPTTAGTYLVTATATAPKATSVLTLIWTVT